jgi:hypothetical protein
MALGGSDVVDFLFMDFPNLKRQFRQPMSGLGVSIGPCNCFGCIQRVESL